MQSNDLSVITLAIVIVWIAGFILFYGTQAFSAARFPLLFLLILVPIPEAALERSSSFFQAGSAWAAYKLLQLLSIPVFKQDFELRLPTLDVEVARECSGIRSSLALFISILILSQYVLRSTWRKVVLSSCEPPNPDLEERCANRNDLPLVDLYRSSIPARLAARIWGNCVLRVGAAGVDSNRPCSAQARKQFEFKKS